MSAALKIPRVDTLYRACFTAFAASGALLVIYGREIIHNLYRTVGASLFTLAAGDTSVEAHLSDLSTLVVAATLNDHGGGVVDEMDNAVGAGLYTQTTADTATGIYTSNATLLVDADSISGAYLYTVAVAEAGEGTHTVTRIGEVSVTAGGDTLVVVSLRDYVAGTATSNVSNSLDNVLSSNTENVGNTLCGRVAAGNTEVGLITLALCKSLCIAVAARVAAGTAVSTRKAVTDSDLALIDLNAEVALCQSKEHRTHDGDSGKNKNGD